MSARRWFSFGCLGVGGVILVGSLWVGLTASELTPEAAGDSRAQQYQTLGGVLIIGGVVLGALMCVIGGALLVTGRRPAKPDATAQTDPTAPTTPRRMGW